MTLSELLDRVFTLYRNNFWLFCGMMALPEVIGAGLSIIFSFSFQIPNPAAMQPNPQDPFAALAAMGSILAAALVIGLLRGIFISIGLAAVTLAVSEIYLGRVASIRECYRAVLKRLPALIGLILLLILIAIAIIFVGAVAGGIAGALLGGVLSFVSPILTGIVVFIFLIAGLIFGTWLLMRFSVSIPAFMLERLGALDSLSRSGRLTKGHRGRIFLAFIVMYVVVYALQVLFSMPFIILTMVQAAKGIMPTWLQVGTSISAAVAGTLAGPLLMITLALMYYDVRIRKEAFDLENMMAGIGPSGGSTATPGAAPPWQPAP